MSRFGCKPPVVAPHLHRMSFRLHGAMQASPPSAVDLRETGGVADVKDQGGSSGCEGHSCSGATETAFELAGDPLGFVPSEAGLYTGGRAVERARSAAASTRLPSLVDEGAMTEDVLSFMSTFGVRARRVSQTSDGRNSDVEMATVNDEPTLGDVEESAQLIVVGPYAIDPQAADTELQVQSSLAAKIPVRVDAFVDSTFEDWTPSRPPVPAPNTKDPNGGGHALYIVGYANGVYFVRNSWGTSWGESGDVRVSRAWVRTSWGLYPWTVRRAA